VARRRQPNLTVVLENVHDPFNIGAVLRSCDSVGIPEVFVVYTEDRLKPKPELPIGRRTAMGSQKWLDVHLYTNLEQCMDRVRTRYDRIFSTHLDEQATTLYELDLTQSVALLFGNEHDGLTERILAYSDGNFIIPQVGMAQSLNISVACAVSVFEAMRQRREKKFYDQNLPASLDQQAKLVKDYLNRHEQRYSGTVIYHKDDADAS
jgi:tRNA (guanosine-2'-O-)-methyltransferase